MREEDVDTADDVTVPPTSSAPPPPPPDYVSPLGDGKTKAEILNNMPNARSLGGTKIVYSRRGEEADTLIIRDLNPLTEFDRVGLKGSQNIEALMYTIIRMLYGKSDELC
jgi:hypothetical protein